MYKYCLLLVLILAPTQSLAAFFFFATADQHRCDDFFSAIELLLPLAEESNAQAQPVLAPMHKYGERVKQDLETAY